MNIKGIMSIWEKKDIKPLLTMLVFALIPFLGYINGAENYYDTSLIIFAVASALLFLYFIFILILRILVSNKMTNFIERLVETKDKKELREMREAYKKRGISKGEVVEAYKRYCSEMRYGITSTFLVGKFKNEKVSKLSSTNFLKAYVLNDDFYDKYKPNKA